MRAHFCNVCLGTNQMSYLSLSLFKSTGSHKEMEIYGVVFAFSAINNQEKIIQKIKN